ncbi:hypothetical protein KR009_008499 [Drosophila setifemur]|nr:hypothetical protein KR009_008499 [Drosophila setifemur]
MLIAFAFLAYSMPEILARNCQPGLRLRSNGLANRESQIDLSQLSEKQLESLLQQLATFQSKREQNQEQDQEEDQVEHQDLHEFEEEDNRGSSRPWNKVQRIIRRQLVKIPKRYLKKFLRQFGLARSAGYGSAIELRSAQIMPQLEEYYVIPLE